MPIEHEFKYVVSLDLLKEWPEAKLRIECKDWRSMEQGVALHGPGAYLRVRSVTVKGTTSWFLTFKKKDCDETVEIENPIGEEDALKLWAGCYWKLKKDRYIFKDGDLKWEVDLFKNGKDIYFILVEVELPPGAPRPKAMPDFLQKNLIYEVPLIDDRCSNKKLGDVSYATKLYAQLVAGKESDGRLTA